MIVSVFAWFVFSFQRTISFEVLPSKLNKVSLVCFRLPFATSFSISTLRHFGFLRKEVIQPQVLLRLPCYDFTPVICPALDGSFHISG